MHPEFMVCIGPEDSSKLLKTNKNNALRELHVRVQIKGNLEFQQIDDE